MPMRPEDIRRQRTILPIVMASLLLSSVAAAWGVGKLRENSVARGLAEPVRVGRAMVRLPLGWERRASWSGLLGEPSVDVEEPRRRSPRSIKVTVFESKPRGWDTPEEESIAVQFGTSGTGSCMMFLGAGDVRELVAEGTLGDGVWMSITLDNAGRNEDDFVLISKIAASARIAK